MRRRDKSGNLLPPDIPAEFAGVSRRTFNLIRRMGYESVAQLRVNRQWEVPHKSGNTDRRHMYGLGEVSRREIFALLGETPKAGTQQSDEVWGSPPIGAAV